MDDQQLCEYLYDGLVAAASLSAICKPPSQKAAMGLNQAGGGVIDHKRTSWAAAHDATSIALLDTQKRWSTILLDSLGDLMTK